MSSGSGVPVPSVGPEVSGSIGCSIARSSEVSGATGSLEFSSSVPGLPLGVEANQSLIWSACLFQR